jgi:hypothetical protein
VARARHPWSVRTCHVSRRCAGGVGIDVVNVTRLQTCRRSSDSNNRWMTVTVIGLAKPSKPQGSQRHLGYQSQTPSTVPNMHSSCKQVQEAAQHTFMGLQRQQDKVGSTCAPPTPSPPPTQLEWMNHHPYPHEHHGHYWPPLPPPSNTHPHLLTAVPGGGMTTPPCPAAVAQSCGGRRM